MGYGWDPHGYCMSIALNVSGVHVGFCVGTE